MNNYPIDKIIVMTLARSQNRQWAFLGASSIMQVDPSLIYFANGKDNLDYDDDMEKIVEAATTDGFPWVADYARDMKDEFRQQTPATACQAWNYCRILRYLVEHSQTALVIFDDKMFTLDFSLLMELTAEAKAVEDKEFYALQLMLRGGGAELHLPELSYHTRHQMSSDIYAGATGKPGTYRDLFLQETITGYDETFVFSPQGAEWFLKCIGIAPDYYFYLDHFICQAMPEFAKQAVKKGKGIYCPSEVGYKFVDQLMPVGTTTDWAVEGSFNYEDSRKEVVAQYLFDEPKPENRKHTKQEKKKRVKQTGSLEKKLESILQKNVNPESSDV